MKLEIYANYGVLAHEYQTIYTYGGQHQHAVTSERLTVNIPDNLVVGQNNFDVPLLKVPGMSWTYTLPDLLTHRNNMPCLRWFDGHSNQYIMLESCASEVQHDEKDSI